jgi:hypothetical protein
MYEIKNYIKEFYINGKLIGKIILEKPDREKLGYSGKRLEILSEDIKFKKLYKKGTEVYTETSPICGKVLGTQKEKFQILANSRIKF